MPCHPPVTSCLPPANRVTPCHSLSPPLPHPPPICLCDCPSLVFLSRELQVVPQPPPILINTALMASIPSLLQVLAGVYPISQLQEPYSAVGFLASRLPLPTLLGLRPPSTPAGWTAWDICEGERRPLCHPVPPVFP